MSAVCLLLAVVVVVVVFARVSWLIISCYTVACCLLIAAARCSLQLQICLYNMCIHVWMLQWPLLYVGTCCDCCHRLLALFVTLVDFVRISFSINKCFWLLGVAHI